MADEEGIHEEEGQQEGGEGQEPQRRTDWKAMARKWERLAKENADKAKSFDELQEASKTELEKAQEAKVKAERELGEYRAKAEREALRSKVAKMTGLPASLVFGSDEEEMEANAKATIAWARPSAPKTGHAGSFDTRGSADDGLSAAKRRLADQLFGTGE